MEVKSTPPVTEITGALPIELDGAALDVAERARRFAEDVLMPLEEQAEQRSGRLGEDAVAEIRRRAIEARLNGGMHAVEYGGQGWTRLEWALVEEQYGRTTNALHWHVPNAYNVWAHASPEQVNRYLRPALRGELKDAYAVTEQDAGSDPSAIAATAAPTGSGFLLNAEKWFVTAGDVASVYVVMANVVDGAKRLPTLFVVDRARRGVEIVDAPAYTHNYPEGHPTVRFNEVELSAEDVIGEVGAGDELQRSWFTEERLGIAARCGGAGWGGPGAEGAGAARGGGGGGRGFLFHGGAGPPPAPGPRDPGGRPPPPP